MHYATPRATRTIAALALGLTLAGPAGPALAGPAAGGDTPRTPVVVRAVVDQVEPDRLVIRGRNFGEDEAPVVLLSDVSLDVVSFSDEEIVARLPLDAPPARYRLQVLAHGQHSSTGFEVTLGRRSGRHQAG